MPENHTSDDPTTSKAILEMLTVAHEYCLFFERTEAYRHNDIVNYFRKIAPLLYLKGSTLPDVEVTDDAWNERFVTEEQWERVFKNLRDKLGDDDTYYVLDQNNDTRQASLSDNMADIYQDMKDFVMLYQRGTMHARENAVSQVKELMATRWGPTLIDALKACHVKYFKNLIDPDLFAGDSDWLL